MKGTYEPKSISSTWNIFLSFSPPPSNCTKERIFKSLGDQVTPESFGQLLFNVQSIFVVLVSPASKLRDSPQVMIPSEVVSELRKSMKVW